jgi:hypothetical protein
MPSASPRFGLTIAACVIRKSFKTKRITRDVATNGTHCTLSSLVMRDCANEPAARRASRSTGQGQSVAIRVQNHRYMEAM